MENSKAIDNHNILESFCPECKGPCNAIEVIEIMPNFNEENEEQTEISSTNDVQTSNTLYSEVDELTIGNNCISLDNCDVQSTSDVSISSSVLNDKFNDYMSGFDECLPSPLSEDEFDTNDSDVESLRTCDLISRTSSSPELSFPNNNCIVKQNCAVKLCNEYARNHFDNLFFIDFPNETLLCDYWWQKCGRKEKFDPSFKICSIHFNANEFTSIGKNSNLKNRNTVPTLYLSPHEYTKFTRKQEKNISDCINTEVENQSSETTACVIKSCKKTYSKDGRTTLFFKFPLSNKSLLKEWLRKIKLSNWQPLDSDRICSDHFENYYIKYSSNSYQLDEYATPSIKPKNPFVIKSINMFNQNKINERSNVIQYVETQYENLEFTSVGDDILLVYPNKNNTEKEKTILLNSFENNTEKDEQQIHRKKLETASMFSNVSENNFNNNNILLIHEKKRKCIKEDGTLSDLLENNVAKDGQQISHKEIPSIATTHFNLTKTNITESDVLLTSEKKRKHSEKEESSFLEWLENNTGKEDQQKLHKEKLETAINILNVSETDFNKGNILLINEENKKTCEEENSSLLNLLENYTGQDKKQNLHSEISETASTVLNLSNGNFNKGENVLNSSTNDNNSSLEYMDFLDDMNDIELQLRLENSKSITREYLESFTREITEELIDGNSNSNNDDLDNIDLDLFNCGSMEEVQPINNTNDGFTDTLTTKNEDLKTGKCDTICVSPIECDLCSNRDKQVNDVPTTDFVKESLKLLNNYHDLCVSENDPEDSQENVPSEEFEKALSFIESMPRIIKSYSLPSETKTQFFMTSISLEIMYKMYIEQYITETSRPLLTEGQFSKIYHQSMETMRFCLNEQFKEKDV